MTCAGVLRRRRGVCSQTRRAPVGATMTDFRRISRHRPWAAAGWRGRGWQQCSSFPRLVTGGQHHVSGGGQVLLSVHPAPRTRHAALLLRQQPAALRTPPPPPPPSVVSVLIAGGGAGRVASHCNLVPISRQLGPGLSVMCTVSAEQRSLQRSYAAQVCKQLSPPHQPSSP